MMKKSDIATLPAYFDRYIDLTENLPFMEVLQKSLKELEEFPVEKYKALGESVYAAGKWTAKDLLQHLIDTERVFSYRMTAFSRGDSQRMLAFDEDLYAQNATANRRSIEDLLEELILVRKNYIALYQSFSPEMLLKSGTGYDGNEYSVLSMAFMIPGHQRWHLKIVEERYFPLLLKIENQS